MRLARLGREDLRSRRAINGYDKFFSFFDFIWNSPRAPIDARSRWPLEEFFEIVRPAGAERFF